MVPINESKMADLLGRLDAAHARATALVRPALHGGEPPPVSSDTPTSTEDRCNAALGCQTSEVALAILAQVVQFQHLTAAALTDERVDTLMVQATAMLAELHPTNATEAFLAAQMVGTQRLAMQFLSSSTCEGQTVQGTDAHILRATRLMRLFNEQVDTMAKLKGKGGQQRVVVEHVSVAAGGQAIVGNVTPRGGRHGDDSE